MFAEGIIDQTWQCVLELVLWACLSSEEGQVTGSAAAGFFLRVFGVFPGPRTLGGQRAMVRTGGLGRDPLARQVLVWVSLVSVMCILCVKDFPRIFFRTEIKILLGCFPVRHTVGVW